jgi:hypothetical protein
LEKPGFVQTKTLVFTGQYCAIKTPQSAKKSKKKFSGVPLAETFRLLGQTEFVLWEIQAAPRLPSSLFSQWYSRFDVFGLTNSEAAKFLFIDALFLEVLPSFPKLRAWKAASLESDRFTGVVNYLIAPKRPT